jgi:hypothetical protein
MATCPTNLMKYTEGLRIQYTNLPEVLKPFSSISCPDDIKNIFLKLVEQGAIKSAGLYIILLSQQHKIQGVAKCIDSTYNLGLACAASVPTITYLEYAPSNDISAFENYYVTFYEGGAGKQTGRYKLGEALLMLAKLFNFKLLDLMIIKTDEGVYNSYTSYLEKGKLQSLDLLTNLALNTILGGVSKI